MAEHFPDATKKVDFIRRDKVHVQIERALCEGLPYHRTIDDIPAADVVARDCYDRILAENDAMREMLARIGKKCGDSMDDVRPVVEAHWEWDENGMDWNLGAWKCSNCRCKAETWWANDKHNPLRCAGSHFCGNCGAEMLYARRERRMTNEPQENTEMK